MEQQMRAITKELQKKGYHYYADYKSNDEAKKLADELRKSGIKARVVKESTYVKGLHVYCVWVKR